MTMPHISHNRFENRVARHPLAASAMPILVAAVAALIVCAGCVDKGASTVSEYRAARQASDDAFAAAAGQPPNAKTMYALAKVLIDQGRDRDAVFLLTRIVQQYPAYLPAYNELGGVYLRSDRLDDAITVLSAGLKQSPADAVLHNNVGMCRFLKEDYEAATASFHYAARAVPDNPVYRANEAAALGMLGRATEADASYRGVVSPVEAQHNLAVLDKARRDRTGAAAAAATTSPSLLDQAAPAARPDK